MWTIINKCTISIYTLRPFSVVHPKLLSPTELMVVGCVVGTGDVVSSYFQERSEVA